ncbi:hypothetical protein AC249_AIPGENE21424 [Exaiptasia diaphana]|nr:hypothetical protein AC249_AIPGENE21424 [Exaiptasia diaphana]
MSFHRSFYFTFHSLFFFSKNLEFERDELRKQVNELCENTLTEEKATQTDLFQSSPRRKETRGRKRSKSVGVIVPIISIDGVDGEESNSSPDRSPTSDSPRHQKHS